MVCTISISDRRSSGGPYKDEHGAISCADGCEWRFVLWLSLAWPQISKAQVWIHCGKVKMPTKKYSAYKMRLQNVMNKISLLGGSSPCPSESLINACFSVPEPNSIPQSTRRQLGASFCPRLPRVRDRMRLNHLAITK